MSWMHCWFRPRRRIHEARESSRTDRLASVDRPTAAETWDLTPEEERRYIGARSGLGCVASIAIAVLVLVALVGGFLYAISSMTSSDEPVNPELDRLERLFDKIEPEDAVKVREFRVEDCAAASGSPYVGRKYKLHGSSDDAYQGYQAALSERGWELAPIAGFDFLHMQKQMSGRYAFVSVEAGRAQYTVKGNLNC